MASVRPPKIERQPSIPAVVVEQGRLSNIQLEAIALAGQSHDQQLADGSRKGLFVGDSTGVGKGTELAGMMLDNWRRGRKKHVWVSENQKLLKDAERDVDWVGLGKDKMFPQSGVKGQIKAEEGVVYTTYDTLTGKAKDTRDADGNLVQGQRRMDQLVEWLGEDFRRVNDAAQRVQRSHGALDETTEAREIVARMAEDGIKMPFIKRAVAAMRRFSRRVGLSVRWSQSELEARIARAGRRLERESSSVRERVSGDTTFARAADAVGMARDAFKRWFGDSKVVDGSGEPKIVYHGTARGDFESFDAFASNYGLMGKGAYLTEDPSIASEHTRKGKRSMERRSKDPAPTVYPIYLSIQSPMDMDASADVDAWTRAFDEWLDPALLPESPTNEQVYREVEEVLSSEMMPADEGAEIMQGGLMEMGYDGVTHVGGGRVHSHGSRHRVWIAFEPEQIKSATGNRGTLDPADPWITFAREQP